VRGSDYTVRAKNSVGRTDPRLKPQRECARPGDRTGCELDSKWLAARKTLTGKTGLLDDELGIHTFHHEHQGSVMNTRFAVASAVAALAAVALLLLPGKVQAHPRLIGTWNSVYPADAEMAYTFEPGAYIGAGVWRGKFTVFCGNMPISNGCYELRMCDGTKGTIMLQDGVPPPGGILVGNIDVGTTRVMTVKGVTYRP
jgi:hypothetical protein